MRENKPLLSCLIKGVRPPRFYWRVPVDAHRQWRLNRSKEQTKEKPSAQGVRKIFSFLELNKVNTYN